MKGIELINKTRQYLDYLEEHLKNVEKAYTVVKSACFDLFNDWDGLYADISEHDLSKFSKEEFTDYRCFYFTAYFESKPANIDEAWNAHLNANGTHHPQSAFYDDTSRKSILHTVIDLTAMGYTFGATAQEYYQSHREEFPFTDMADFYINTIFQRLEDYKNDTNFV
jgi:hypothetical protein